MAWYYFIEWTLLWNSVLLSNLVIGSTPYRTYTTSYKRYNKPELVSVEHTFETPNYDQSDLEYKNTTIQDSGSYLNKFSVPHRQYGRWQGNVLYSRNENDSNDQNFDSRVNNTERTMNVELYEDNVQSAAKDPRNGQPKNSISIRSTPWVNGHDSTAPTYQSRKIHNAARGLISSMMDGLNNVRSQMQYTASSVMQTGGNIINSVVGSVRYNTKVVLRGLVNVGISGVKIGGQIIRPPLLAADKLMRTIGFVNSLGKGLLFNLTRDVGSGLQQGWESVTSLQLPGWNVIMFFPNGLISIVNKVYKTLWYLTSTVKEYVSAAKAYSIYQGLNLISATLGPTMRALGLDCVRLKALNINVGKTMVDTISTTSGRVCGLTSIEAVNNVTITTDDKYFLIVKVPYAINNMTINFENTTVSGLLGNQIENEKMKISISRVRVLGRITFQGGTLIRFMLLKLRVVKLGGFQIKFGGDETNDIMDIVENLSDFIGSIVTKTINKKLSKFEKRIYKYIINGY